jgi:hypothetical protein
MDKTGVAVQMMCAVILMANLLGGIVATALHAYEKPAAEADWKHRISFRAFLAGEIIFIALAAYYHYSYKTPTTVEWVFWVMTFLLAPLVAKFGSLLSGLAYEKKLASRRKAWAKWLDENTSEEEKIAQAIEKQSKVTDDKDHDDFAFMKNYTKEELK